MISMISSIYRDQKVVEFVKLINAASEIYMGRVITRMGASFEAVLK